MYRRVLFSIGLCAARRVLLAASLVCGVSGLAWAEYRNAIAAFDRGDYATALRELWPSAVQGDPAAEFMLGRMYAEGKGVPQNHSNAAGWYRRAAEQWHAAAQYELASLYASGIGVPRNYVLAHMWGDLAASRLPPGEERRSAVKLRDTVASSLTPEQLARARDMARHWRPKIEPQPRLTATQDSTAQLLAMMVQGNLTRLGYDPGPLNGTLGPQTRAAINAYQAAAGLPVDGEISTALVVNLATAQATARAAMPPPAETARKLAGAGIGFIVSEDGEALTVKRVIAGCAEVRARHDAGTGDMVAVAAVDARNDLALLRLPAGTGSAARFRDGPGVRPGDGLIVLGYPPQGPPASDGQVATGTVSALAGPRDDDRYLQIEVPVQPGSGGGPLLDLSGNVVGVVIETPGALRLAAIFGDGPQNTNFALKDSVARGFLDAHGVEYWSAPSEGELSAADMAEAASQFMVRVECWK